MITISVIVISVVILFTFKFSMDSTTVIRQLTGKVEKGRRKNEEESTGKKKYCQDGYKTVGYLILLF